MEKWLHCVFDLNLKLCCSSELNQFCPIGTAKFQDCSIVTSEVAIKVIKFDFERKSFNVVKIIMSNGVSFKLNFILRGVCCSNKYIYIIYVSQRTHEYPGFVPILCLQLDESKCNLEYVCEVDDYASKL